MSFLKRQRRILNRIEEKYKELEENLARLIDDIRNDPKFPENAEETLYSFSGEGGCSELALVKNLKETYALTKNGVKKYWELRLEGDKSPKLILSKINSEKLASDRTDPLLFNQVCDNVQKIIDKYKMKIDKKKYLIKIRA